MPFSLPGVESHHPSSIIRAVLSTGFGQDVERHRIKSGHHMQGLEVVGDPMKLVGGWTNPSEKYARQIGNLSQSSGWKSKNVWVATT